MTATATASQRKARRMEHPQVRLWIKDRARIGTGVTQSDHLRQFLDPSALEVDGPVEPAKEDAPQLKSRLVDWGKDQPAGG